MMNSPFLTPPMTLAGLEVIVDDRVTRSEVANKRLKDRKRWHHKRRYFDRINKKWLKRYGVTVKWNAIKMRHRIIIPSHIYRELRNQLGT